MEPKEKKRERTVSFKVVCKLNSFSLLGLYNNYLFLKRRNSRIFQIKPNIDNEVRIYLKGNYFL